MIAARNCGPEGSRRRCAPPPIRPLRGKRSWRDGGGASAPTAIRRAEHEWEQRVSEYLGSVEVLWLAVPDPPGPDSDRARVERNALALLSRGRNLVDPPTADWLGWHCTRPAVMTSGLWNVRHTDEPYDLAFLDVLAEYVAAVR